MVTNLVEETISELDHDGNKNITWNEFKSNS